MATDNETSAATDIIEVDLKNRNIAGVLAWLWPGAGHIYQGRYGKGALFMVCILGTFFFGFVLGDGHVVYASLSHPDGEPSNIPPILQRWQYLPQLGVGAIAFPALVQAVQVKNGREPLWGGFMAPPRERGQLIDFPNGNDDELAVWHRKLGNAFELGTLYTVIAGLLNFLAIYDAYGGPFVSIPENETDESPEKSRKKKTDPDENKPVDEPVEVNR